MRLNWGAATLPDPRDRRLQRERPLRVGYRPRTPPDWCLQRERLLRGCHRPPTPARLAPPARRRRQSGKSKGR
eukprot:6488447-Alexandrium_andersonii.AAC.1